MITREGLWVESLTPLMENRLTAKEPQYDKDNVFIKRHAYRHINGKYLLPRIYTDRTISNVHCSNMLKSCRVINCVANVTLTDLQDKVYDYVNSTYTLKPFYNLYIKMATGTGKTILALSLIEIFKAPTFVVVPTKAIADQWISTVKTLYPNFIVGKYKKDITTPQVYDVVVCVVNTFYKQSIDFLDGYGYTILDEAHEYKSKQFINTLYIAQTKYVIGLSATPFKNDTNIGYERLVPMFLGPPKEFNTAVDQFDYNVTVVEYYSAEHTEPVKLDNGNISTILTIKQIIDDNNRTELIGKMVYRLLDKGVNGIFIFSELRDYLLVIKDHLCKDVLIKEPSIMYGGTTEEEFEIIKYKDAHIVLTTYGYSRRGISLPEMTALILATPRKTSLKQIIGRITRLGSDTSIVREIVDIVDMRSILQYQYNERKSVYNELMCPISIEKCIQ